MFVKYSQGGKIAHNFSKYIAEDETDLAKAPPTCDFGDIAYVVHTAEYWMMDTKGTWYPMSANGKDGIVCDCVEEMTIWGQLPENEN